MKDLNLIVWLTQLGISVAAPLAGFVLLAVWLRQKLGWGAWVIWVGIVLGTISAVDGLIHSIKIMGRLSKNKKDSDTTPISFNEHD